MLLELIVRGLSYPSIQLSMWIDQWGGGNGLTLGLLLLALLCTMCVIERRTGLQKNVLAVLGIFVPFVVWFGWFCLPVSNAGVGNFVLEIGTLLTLSVVLSVLYRLVLFLKTDARKFGYSYPFWWMMIAVCALRLAMPFVGK